MSKFNTTIQKLRKLWEQIHKNQSDLSNSDNTDELDFFKKLSQQQTIKNVVEILDSGFFIAKTVVAQDASFLTLDENGIEVTTTVNKNTKLPSVYEYTRNLELDIPEELLPFIKVVPEVKPLPDNDLSLAGLFISSRFGLANDIIQIKGDGSLLYKGSPQRINSNIFRTNTLLSVFTQDELDTFDIPLANTKKVFKATVEYVRGGKTFRVTGNLVRMFANFDVGTGCDGNTNEDSYDALVFQESSFSFIPERGDNEFLSLTSTNFSIKAKQTERRFVNVPPCTLQDTITEGFTKTASFASTSSYTLQIHGKHINITDSLFLGNNQLVSVDTSSDTINSQIFEDIGQRVYYSNGKEGVLSVRETGFPDGNFLKELVLDGLPNTAIGHTLPYTTINFLRNLNTFDREIFETDTYIQHSRQLLKHYFKKSNGQFFITLKGTFLLVSPATKEDPNSRQFPEYNDAYTVSGVSYVATTVNHSFVDTPIYIPDVLDVQVRLRIFLQNPLYWKEDRKYDI